MRIANCGNERDARCEWILEKAWRGQRDIGVGNVVGSNLFNILGVFLGYYIAYVTFLILSGSGNDLSRTFALAMIWFVLPITLVTLIVSVVRGSNECPVDV